MRATTVDVALDQIAEYRATIAERAPFANGQTHAVQPTDDV